MLSKLALKNAGKSIREYAIYFFTLAFGVCVFYLFNSIYAQQAMMNLTKTQSDSIRAIMQLLSYVSVFVAVVLGFLIVYANNFFIRRRKQELGIYMTLGMSKGRISLIVVLETSLIAILALACGLAAGVVLSQFMSIFTAKLFEVDLTGFQFIFAPDAALKSILYFGVIFLVVILFTMVTISKFKLIDLIYGGRKNETLRLRSVRLSAVLFALSIAILGTAYYLIISGGMMNVKSWKFSGSILLGILGTLLFFYSLSGLLTLLLRANKRVYYKGLNMFVVRQLSCKINTNFISISVVCIVLLLTIGIFSVGYSMQELMSTTMRDAVLYDFTFTELAEEDASAEGAFTEIYALMDGSEAVQSSAEIHLYDTAVYYTDLHMQIADDVDEDWFNSNTISCMSLSDYNAALGLRGEPALTLADMEYAILITYPVWQSSGQKLVDSHQVLRLGGTSLTPKTMATEAFDNNYWTPIVVVPDQYTQGLTCSRVELSLQCTGEAAQQAFLQQIQAQHFDEQTTEERGFAYYDSRIELYEQSVNSRAMLSFLAIYLGLVFMMTCAAILAIQQLTDVADNRFRYELLSKLGADGSMLRRALLTQIACYFLLPLLLAVVHAFFGLWAANDALVAVQTHIGPGLVSTAAFVGVLYLAYFGMTYAGAKSCLNLKS